MSAELTTGLRGLEDITQAAAGGTINRTRIVNGTSETGTITKFTASNFPILATADATAVTNAGGVATYPGPAITELNARIGTAFATVAAARATTRTPSADQFIIVAGRAYYWDATSTAADDGVSVIKITAITTGRLLSASVYAADTATTATTATNATATGIKTATTTVDVQGATAPTADQILIASSTTLAAWGANYSQGFKSATTNVNTVAGAAPAANDVLTATGASAATWQAPIANGLRNATTNVSTLAAAEPTSGQVLTATANNTATWQSPTAVAASKVAFSNITQSIAGGGGTFNLVLAMGIGHACVIVYLTNVVGTGGGGGSVFVSTTAGESQSVMTNSSAYRGAATLSSELFGGGQIALYTAVYNSGTGDCTLTFRNAPAGAQTLTVYGIAAGI